MDLSSRPNACDVAGVEEVDLSLERPSLGHPGCSLSAAHREAAHEVVRGVIESVVQQEEDSQESFKKTSASTMEDNVCLQSHALSGGSNSHHVSAPPFSEKNSSATAASQKPLEKVKLSRSDFAHIKLYDSERERVSHVVSMRYVALLEEKEEKRRRAEALARTREILKQLVVRKPQL